MILLFSHSSVFLTEHSYITGERWNHVKNYRSLIQTCKSVRFLELILVKDPATVFSIKMYRKNSLFHSISIPTPPHSIGSLYFLGARSLKQEWVGARVCVGRDSCCQRLVVCTLLCLLQLTLHAAAAPDEAACTRRVPMVCEAVLTVGIVCRPSVMSLPYSTCTKIVFRAPRRMKEWSRPSIPLPPRLHQPNLHFCLPLSLSLFFLWKKRVGREADKMVKLK